MRRRTHRLLFGFICLLLPGMALSGMPDDKPRTITLRAVPGMRFDPLRLQVAPGEKVRIVFTNADDMSHNLLITTPGNRAAVVEAAQNLAEKGPEKNYIPDQNVLASLPVISPGDIRALSFTAPDKEGVYPYVCTFPGHGYVMYGAIYVTNKALPPAAHDENLPESARSGHAHIAGGARFHPYPAAPPRLYRIFMPNAGPASMAVHLTDSLSYCWDTESARLLYAWKGGFVDNAAAWRGHANAEATLLGEVFYEAPASCPLKSEKHPDGTVIFKGYTLVNGYPEFHYSVGGLDVHELIRPGKNPLEWTHSYRIRGATGNVSLDTSGKGRYSVSHTRGQLKENKLMLNSREAGAFAVTYRFKTGS